MPTVPKPPFSIQLHDRGEELVYNRGSLEVFLARTCCDGQRLFFTDCELDSGDSLLRTEARLTLLEDLCQHFDTRRKELVLVLDEEDKDRVAVEAHIDGLIEDGHRLQLEWDSEALRAARMDEMYLDIIASRSALVLEGVEIDSPESYWRWKSTRSRAG